MLACQEILTREQLGDLKYPLIISLKKDGYRCITHARRGQVWPMSRTFTPINNCHIQSWADEMPTLFDGELTIPGLTFHELQSKLNTGITMPFIFRFYVFDHIGFQKEPYWKRLQLLQNQLDRYNPPFTRMMPHKWCKSADAVWDQYQEWINQGEEGAIIRDAGAPYKQGRSTLNEGWMLKLKQWETHKARVIGFVEAEENLNPKKENNVGLSKRSSHKANKRGKNTLGALVARDLKTGVEFQIGSGWTAGMAQQIWNNRTAYMGRVFTYKKLAHGEKEKPRSPIWLGFRNKQDL